MNVLFVVLNNWFYVFALIFIIASVMLLYVNLRRIQRANQVTSCSTEDFIVANLALLENEEDPEKVAQAFGELIKCEYVSLHTLKNCGNNYDDKKQIEVYRRSITEKSMTVLFELEGHDGGNLF